MAFSKSARMSGGVRIPGMSLADHCNLVTTSGDESEGDDPSYLWHLMFMESLGRLSLSGPRVDLG